MHTTALHRWQHSHTFGQERHSVAETSAYFVIALTAITMVAEIVTGILFGSMALLADGLHMGSHTLALGISAFAYYYTRKHADDARFSFGTGKVNSLAGFSSAILLLLFASLMAWESFHRFFTPIAIHFNQAILVAFIGLAVNIASVLILSRPQRTSHHDQTTHDHDHSFKAAYFHVLADALTSLFAIFALFAGKYLGLVWMDPAMGVIGAVLVSRWALILLGETSGILLDKQAPEEMQEKIKTSIEAATTDRIADLHIWSIGRNMYLVNISLVSENPKEPKHYKQLLPKEYAIVHSTIEIQKCE